MESRLTPQKEKGPFWSRHLRREVQYVLDLGLLAAAFALAYLVRFDFQPPLDEARRALIQLPVVILLQFFVVLLLGVYNFVWRYVGMEEIRAFVSSAFFSATPLVLMRLGLPDAFDSFRVPLSIILMDTVFAFGGLLALRVTRRALYERFERQRRHTTKSKEKALLVGAGRAGAMAAREIAGRGDTDIEPVGFVDDDPAKQGSVISGLKVLGTTADIPRLVAALQVDQVTITIADADAATIRSIVDQCDRIGTKVRIIPGLYEILQGKLSISRFRDVRIEDLLGRDPVKLDDDELRLFLTGKSVLLTGAGGSIGAELARQIARFSPLKLLLLERAEGALFEIHRELIQLWPSLEIHALVGDIGDGHRMQSVLEQHRPQVIFHAAAHKHVPLMESNPSEAIRNNVLGTELLAGLAGEIGVEAFVLISTDKAVRPSSLMGASKRVAELVIQALADRYPKSRYLAVRFGNVLGSAGSVVPIFTEQIEAGGPLTVTHPDAARYFMTIPEAAQLVLQAGAIGSDGDILILDMGTPIKIIDLACDMISLSGYKPYEDIEIVFTGLRPGEKLNEELSLSDELMDGTRHPKIFVGKLHGYPPERVAAAVQSLRELVEVGKPGEIRLLLNELLPEAQLDRRLERLPVEYRRRSGELVG